LGEKGGFKTTSLDFYIGILYTWDMNLHIPKEPEHVKNWMKTVEVNIVKTPGVNWDNVNVWYGNQLPKYLWEHWGNQLKTQGFTWQIFLRVLKHRTDAVLLWNKGIIKWDDLAQEFINLIEGPFGKEIVARYAKNNHE